MRNLFRLLALSLVLLAWHAPAKTSASSAKPSASPTPTHKPTSLVTCGKEQVAILPGTEPKDGAYALGWTIQRHRARRAVDWTTYDPTDPNAFINRYPTSDNLAPGDYALVSGVVDLRGHRFTPLSSTDAYYPHKPNADLHISWTDEARGFRYALISLDSGDDTVHRWLVDADRGRVRVRDLAPEADTAVRNFLRKNGEKPPKPVKRERRDKRDKRGEPPPRYNVSFAPGGDTPLQPAASPFKNNDLELPYHTYVAEGQDAPTYAGTVQVRLPGGRIANVDGKKTAGTSLPAASPTASSASPASPASPAAPKVTPAAKPAATPDIPSLPTLPDSTPAALPQTPLVPAAAPTPAATPTL